MRHDTATHGQHVRVTNVREDKNVVATATGRIPGHESPSIGTIFIASAPPTVRRHIHQRQHHRDLPEICYRKLGL